MKARLAELRAPFGAAGSLQRNLTVNILVALLVAVLMAAAVMIYEFFEHLEESLDEALTREAQEVLIQANPARPAFGLDPNALRFRGAGGAYRYTVFGPDMQPVAGGEESAAIRSRLAALPLGSPGVVDLPGDRRGMGLCGEAAGQKICVLASAYAPLTDTTILHSMWHELEEQVQWILIGAVLVLASALLAARYSLRPLGRVQNEAHDIGPDTPERRLTSEGLPTEIVPLVDTVNRAFDRLERGYRAQRAFSSNVAHEVRTPLAVLHSSVEAIEDATLRARLKQDLKRLEVIFEQLIDLARAEALLPSAFDEVDLRDLAVRVSGERALVALREGKVLAVSGDGGVRVRGHAGLLMIALDNLVRNALAHAPAGTEVEIHIQSAPRGWQILDRGPGVPVAEREGLFERFKRGDKPAGEGSGLGLAIVKSVAEAHRANVRIEDRPGGGSSFVMEFQQNNTL